MRLAVPGPAEEEIPPGSHGSRLASCDATASGAEDAQVRLARGRAVLDLCTHHLDVYGLELLANGWRVTHDNRGTLR